ncbi:hypothetical protein RB601_008641 [Gaeumannomyces tritici]
MSHPAMAPTVQDLVREAVKLAEADDVDGLKRVLSEFQSAPREPASHTSSDPMFDMQPALDAALRNANVGAAGELLAHGCKPYSGAVSAALQSCKPETGFNLASFECLLAHGWDVNHSTGHLGDALIMAIKYSLFPLAEFLLRNGADPNRNESGAMFPTALGAACGSAEAPPDLVRLLLEKGADAREGAALLAAASAEGGRADVLEVLLQDGAGAALINEVPAGGEYDRFLDEEYWGTPLHGAAAKGNAECVALLLAKGASKEIRNGAGRTPKETAEKHSHGECARLLV